MSPIWNHPALAGVAYALITAFLLIFPLYSVWAIRRFRRREDLSAEETSLWRRRDYRETIIIQWLVSALIGFLYLRGDVAPGEAWLAPSFGALQLAVTALVAVACGVLMWQTLAYRHDAKLRQETMSQLGHLEPLMPRTRGELAWFSALSVTAGFCEELIFRSFLLVILSPQIGFWAAAVVSTLLFGFGHLYQGGLKGFGRTALVGAGMLAVVMLTGSIWPAVVLHIVADLAGGFIGFFCLRDDGDAGVSPDANAEAESDLATAQSSALA